MDSSEDTVKLKHQSNSKRSLFIILSLSIDLVMFSLLTRTFSHQKRVDLFSLRTQTASQPHMVVIKSAFAKVTSANGGRRQCTGINNCQTVHMIGYQEISGVLSCYTCMVLVVRKPKNHPMVEIDHL
ncbi:hypothetical protein AVEN_185087-1 [Araneus ventricosus]|uniref:Uncharacterized protein n=1 Tax=Araneus ventricosus TaxID=182803 RepID=A0A4Y2BPZ9_ARAVE|nr:hypothetical protein AVEN_185087-1 [Araneus ventricosus]